jgi:two-component system LytT family sensor kinase
LPPAPPFRLRLLTFLALHCVTLALHAQSGAFNFRELTPREGLASSNISCLFQDSRNFLWIGHAAGVSRFDGYRFENLLFAGNERVGKVNAVKEDDEGTIWIGTEKGLFFYRFPQLEFINADRMLPVYQFFGDADSLWLASGEGPLLLTRKARHELLKTKQTNWERLLLPAWKQRSPSSQPCVSKGIAANGIVYFTDGNSLFSWNKHELRVRCQMGESDYITGLAIAGKDIYFSALQSGLYRLSGDRCDKLAAPAGTSDALLKKGDSLYLLSGNGIYNYDAGSGRLLLRVPLPPAYSSWQSCFLNDKMNDWWIGTHEQLLFVQRNIFTILPSISGYALTERPDGRLLLGTGKGELLSRDSPADEFRKWRQIFPSAEITSAMEDAEGGLWLSSVNHGIARVYKENVKIFTVKEGLLDNTGYQFIAGEAGSLYAMGEGGVTKIEYARRQTPIFTTYSCPANGTDYPVIRSAVRTGDGRIFFAGNTGLLEIKDDSLASVVIKGSPRQAYIITDIIADPSGHIWISTVGDGILCCFYENGSITFRKSLLPADGLASSIYLRLLRDNDQRVWAMNNRGITRLTPDGPGRCIIDNYGVMQGFPEKAFHGAQLLQDSHQRIWIATSSAVTYFHPSSVSTQYTAPVPIITGINTGSNSDTLLPNSMEVDRSGELPGHLQLPYSSNSITFHFLSVCLSDARRIRYRYRLLGTDTSWIDAGSLRSITFRHLSPGRYRFEVMAAAGNNNWSGAATYIFRIKEPVWKQWWFILLALLIVLSGGYWLVRLRERRIRQREEEKTALQQLKASGFQYQLETEQVINYFATSMSGHVNVDDMLWDVAKNCISRLGFEDCVIYLRDAERNVLVQKAAWGPKTTGEKKIVNPIEIPVGQGIVGAVAQEGKAAIVTDTSLDPRYIVDDQLRLSELAVPVMIKNEVIGVIDSEHHRRNFYNQRHLQIMTTIAALCGDKIDKIKTEQQAREREMEVFKLNQDLATSQMTSLRTQMNPHFIFNALNSIQQFVLKGDVDQTNRYLSRFSRLQREVLLHSEFNFISLEKEIEILDLYLQLEQLRLGNSFQYRIVHGDDMDPAELKIPPMLLQPFAENAIWHGLMPREGDRRLDIHFSLFHDEFLICRITDNGIGREASAKLRAGKGEHQSRGLQLVTKRLQLLQQQYQQTFELQVEDLLGVNNEVEGTMVRLILYCGMNDK